MSRHPSFTLAIAALFASVAGTVPASAEIMTNHQIAAQLIGKPLTTRRNGMSVRLTYLADGTVKMKAFVISAAGTWEYDDSGLCMDMISGPKKGKTCVTFEDLGDNTYRNSQGLILTTTP